MLLFKPEHVEAITVGVVFDGRRYLKRHTRRRGKARWRIGAVHQLRTNMPWQERAGHFGNGRILVVEPTLLLDMNDEDARLEGYADVDRYVEAYLRINRLLYEDAVTEVIWDIGFNFARPGEEVPL
jgi:hypothetical protein